MPSEGALLKPIIESSLRPLAESAFEPTLTPQPGKVTGARSGNDEPGRLDPAVRDQLRALKHEGPLAPTEFAAKPLQADHAGRLVVPQDLQRPHQRFTFDISRERFGDVDLQQRRARALVEGFGFRALNCDLRHGSRTLDHLSSPLRASGSLASLRSAKPG